MASFFLRRVLQIGLLPMPDLVIIGMRLGQHVQYLRNRIQESEEILQEAQAQRKLLPIDERLRVGYLVFFVQKRANDPNSFVLICEA